MHDYTGLTQRLRRIAKVYEDRIASIQYDEYGYKILLKEGYFTKTHETSIVCDAGTDMLFTLKEVRKAPIAQTKVALYSFKCTFCDVQIPRGSNYLDFNGITSCTKCGV